MLKGTDRREEVRIAGCDNNTHSVRGIGLGDGRDLGGDSWTLISHPSISSTLM